MTIAISTTSEDIHHALRLVASHLVQYEPLDAPQLSLAVKRLLGYIIHSIYESIDPFDEPELVGEIEQFDADLLDNVIDHIQRLAQDPLLKPLLIQGKIRDVTFLNDEGLVLFELEIKTDGHHRTTPTLKASFF